MNDERLFDCPFRGGILNPTHEGDHLFSGNFIKNFLQLDDIFEIRPPLNPSDSNPPIFLEVVDGQWKNKRSHSANMKYDDDEIIYAVPVKKEKDEYIIVDGDYYFGNVLVIGYDYHFKGELDFVEIIKYILQKSNNQIISSTNWEDRCGYMHTKDLSLTVCDKNCHYWKILFG
jgi:hypothetical protein